MGIEPFLIASTVHTVIGQRLVRRVADNKDTYQSEKGLAAASVAQGALGQSDTRLGGQERGSVSRVLQPPVIVAMLHSAGPVRQALVRMRQIQAGYDKMKEDDRKKFDQSQSILFNCAICQDYYVVTLTKTKDPSVTAADDGLFQTLKFEDLKGKVWLVNEKDEKRELAQFTPPKRAGDPAVFYFKRADENGAVLVTPENKDVKFVFSYDLLDNKNAYSSLIPRSFDFKVSKLILNGKVEF
jgi:hypothetical protein